MNRKKLVVLAALAIVLIVGLAVLKQYKASFQEVTIHINNPSDTIQVGLYARAGTEGTPQATGPELQTVSNGETFKLKKGMYVLVPKGNQLDTTPVRLSVSDTPVKLTLDIPYTTAYLQQLQTSESDAVQKAIVAKYPLVARDYTINTGTLFHRGEWYGMTLSNKIGPEDNVYGDTLRVVLEKKNGEWVVLSTPPEIILSAPDYPQVPAGILRVINTM